jgi:archaellum component FlaC
MQQAEQQIERIQQKVQHLLKQLKMLEMLNRQLMTELKELKKQRDHQFESMDDIQQQLSVLKAAKSQLSDEEKKAFEKRLGQYIKEIDRCITMLSD